MYNVPEMVPGTRNIAINKAISKDEIFALTELTF